MIKNPFIKSWIPQKNIHWDHVRTIIQKSEETNEFTNYAHCVQELETRIRQEFQVEDTKAVIVVTNGSVALHALVSAIQYFISRQLQWATQSYTFPPSAQGILSCSKIVDIDLNTGGLILDENQLSNVDGLIVTNVFGNIVPIDEYERWAKQKGMYLIFDNAATACTFYKGKNCVNYGDGCTISFHHTKPFGFGEGGAIIVNKRYEWVLRRLTNFGIGLDSSHYFHREMGNNFKMSDISACFILQYLNEYSVTIKKTITTLYLYWKRKLEHLKPFVILYPNASDDSGYIVVSCISLVFQSSETSHHVLKQLHQHEIQARKYYYPLDRSCLNSVYMFDHIVCVPCHIEMTTADIDFIFDIIASSTLPSKVERTYKKAIP